MATYGAVYRRLRQDKNITLKNVEHSTGINNAVISRFERSVTDIGLNKLAPLLAAIHVSQTEFLFEYNYAQAAERGQTPTEIKRYIHELNDPFRVEFADLMSTATYSGDDYEKLRPIIQKHEAAFQAAPNQFELLVLSYYRALYTILKNSKGDVLTSLPSTDRNLQVLKRYLLNVDSWSVFEVLLFLISDMFFTPQDNLQLLRIGYRKSERLSISSEFRPLQFQLLASDFTALLAQKAWTEAGQVLQMMQQQKGSRDLAEKVVTLFYTGWLAIAQGDSVTGEKTCRNAIAIFRVLHASSEEKRWTQYLDQILNDPESSLILLGWTL